uniref:ATP synthase complex subunit 8 n=1 Tax=Cerace xanthocosma TaxID=2789891 RepID=A0A7S9A1S3_9NEOP|nr:ATP synthase F0 subunit 8 [Cerace xanthocosma]QPF22949.1 ATP synthase F0 subunit 8 [Cerace xanthocosma]
MPQMMPINWMLSFLFFIYVFILFNIMNYYIFQMKFFYTKKNKKMTHKIFNWKW